jgi:hypothetical protein
MKRHRVLRTFIVLAVVVALGLIPVPAAATAGDSPLTTSTVWTGHGGVVMEVVPLPWSTTPSGVFTLSGIPSGSTIVSALMYGTDWEYSSGDVASATLGGSAVGTVSPIANDPGSPLRNLATYRWDVTSLVTGNGGYAFTMTGLKYPSGAALVVIYANSTEALRQVTVNDGAENLQYSTSSTTFNGVSPGPGTLMIFTDLDDPVSGVSESISFNGVTILGPGNIFVANQGDFASYFELAVTALPGANTATIDADADHLGWELAVLSVVVTTGGVDEVDIDIKPGSYPNSVNLGSKGTVPVAILTTPEFDASTIDPSTIELAGSGARVKGKSGRAGSLEDVDGDGDLDLVVQVHTEALELSSGDTEAILTASTFDGQSIAGSDSIRVVPVE